MEPDTGRAAGPATKVPFGPGGAGLLPVIASGQAILLGVTFVETTGTAPAAFDVLDGNDAGGILTCPITVLAGESDQRSFGPAGVDIERGIVINVLSGSVRGTIILIRAGD